MLKFNLTPLFKARSIARPSQFLLQMGFSPNTATNFKLGRANMLNLTHVEKLCELLKCTPNDLLEWIPSKEQEQASDHPLTPLRHRNKAEEIVQLINGLNYDKLTEIEGIIKGLSGNASVPK